MENNNPIKEYNSKQKKATELVGIDEKQNKKKSEYITGNDYDEYDEILEDLDIIGEGTDYEERVLKKKKRKKKMIAFMQALMGKYNQNPEYEGTKINKIHFVEKLNVGKEKLGKSVAIPTVYVVETSKQSQSSMEGKELIKYEIYDDSTQNMIMFTDEFGNLILTDSIAQIIGKHYKKLGLQKEDRARMRQINNQLWISSQVNELDKTKKEQNNKTNVSNIVQTLDLEREKIALNLGVQESNIEDMRKLDVTDPILYNLLVKDGKQLDETYIVKEKGQDSYKVLSKDKDGSYKQIDSLEDNNLNKGVGNVKDRNNPDSPGKAVGIINRFNISMGDKTLDLVIYDDGNGNIKAGVMDRDDKENNIIELRDNSARTLDEGVEYIKNDLKDGSIDNSKSREYIKLDIKDPLTEKIQNAMKELQEDGIMWSDLKPEEIEKVREVALNKENASIDDIKDIIEGEIGAERMPKHS